ncbi:transcriptional regulator protein [Arthrobacter sp. Hiyo4]|nr:transcriptional regulator protein [Arthrobacter sp. Hiyo4]
MEKTAARYRRRPGPAAQRGISDQGLREHQSRLPEIVEARSTLEVKLAALAAERRTEEDLAAIDAALEVMAAKIGGATQDPTGAAAAMLAHIELVSDVELLR